MFGFEPDHEASQRGEKCNETEGCYVIGGESMAECAELTPEIRDWLDVCHVSAWTGDGCWRRSREGDGGG